MKKVILLFLILPMLVFSQNQLSTVITSQNNDLEIRENNTVNFTSSRLKLAGINGSVPQETFLRFEGISLPPDAIINSAYLVFYGAVNSTTSTEMKIFGENGSSPVYPTSTSASSGLSIKARNYTTNYTEWTTSECAVNKEYKSPDLKNLLAEMFSTQITNANIAFKIVGNKQGVFTVRSYSATALMRPKLIIDYWSIYGSNTVVISTGYDDGRQNNTGTMTLGTAYLNLGGSSTSKESGIRFQNVNIPSDSEITNAYIEFYSYSTSPSGNINIQAELNNANIYSVSSNNLTNRNYSQGKIAWNEEAITSNYKPIKTPNLKNIIDEARLSNWKDGDNLAFKFNGDGSSNNTRVRSYEGGTAYRPKLVIEYKNNRNGPSITGAITDPNLMDKLFINEISSQGTAIEDEDWIELYNDSENIYHIKEKVFISNRNSNRKRYELKNIIIQPKGFVTLIADNKTEKGNVHLNFTLRNSGESIYLSREVNGTVITQDEATYGLIPYNQSYGRIPNGTGNFELFITPSYNASNENGKQLLNIEFSHERGIYDNDFNLTINSQPGITIKYTLDGKFPSNTAGIVYNSPISINKSTIVKAYAYDANGNNTGVIAHSYILKNSLNNEKTNISNNQWRYVANITEAEFAKAMELVPIVSVSTEQNPNAYYQYATIEYLDSHLYPTRSNFFSTAMTRKFGQESISFFNPNLKYKFNKEAGVKKPSYPFFDQYEGDIFQTPEKTHTIELKQGQDNASRNVFNLGFMRWSEKITMNLQKEMEKYALDTRYVQLYINGRYRGLKTMRNDYKTNNIAEVFGDDNKNYTKIKLQDARFTSGIVEAGDGDQAVWNTIRSSASSKNFQQFKNLVDVDDLIKFQIMFMFIDSENEATAITHNTNPTIMKTKFIINDTDGAFFGANTSSTSNVTMNARAFAGGGGNYKHKWALTSSRNGPGGLFGNFMGSRTNTTTGNLEFKTLVKDAVLKYIGPANGDFKGAEGSPLSVNRVQAKMTEVLTELDPLYKVDAAYMGFRNNVYELWKNVDYPRILAQTPERVEYSLKKWLEYDMAHTLLPVEMLSSNLLNQNEKIKFNNPNTGTQVYYTLNGQDPMGNDGAISNDAILYNDAFKLPSGEYKLNIRAFKTNNWGPSTIESIKVESNELGEFVISGINYKPEVNGDAEFILITNSGNAPLDVSGYYITDAVRYTFPQNSIISQGETIMLAKDLSLIEGFENIEKYQWTSGNLSNSGEPMTFIDTNNTIVDYVHYLPTEPWPTKANGEGYYLSLISTALNNELPESWEAVLIPNLIKEYSILNTNNELVETDEDLINLENSDTTDEELNKDEELLNTSDLDVITTTEPIDFVVSETKDKLYPNPVYDVLNLDLTDEAIIYIYNSSGKLILTQKMNKGDNYINASNWTQGFYQLLINRSNKSETHKIIKR